jgi:hypothetical protein
MLTLDSLLTTYLTLQQENENEIHGQIRQLQQQVTAQLEAIQAQEETFVDSQHEVLDQLRSHLATDGRSLTFTNGFQTFVQSLFTAAGNKLTANPIVPQFAPDPTTWQLHSLKTPLKLDPIELLWEEGLDEEDELSTLYLIRIGMRMGRWQQVVDISTETLAGNSVTVHLPPLHKQWTEVVEQLQASLKRLPLGFGSSASKHSSSQRTTSTQQVLVQELACLVLFVAGLFNVYTIADRLSDTCQWIDPE